VETKDTTELRRLVQEGIDSGPSIDAETVFACLHAKYAKQAKARKAHGVSKASHPG
jgi:hypothetical protein